MVLISCTLANAYELSSGSRSRKTTITRSFLILINKNSIPCLSMFLNKATPFPSRRKEKETTEPKQDDLESLIFFDLV